VRQIGHLLRLYFRCVETPRNQTVTSGGFCWRSVYTFLTHYLDRRVLLLLYQLCSTGGMFLFWVTTLQKRKLFTWERTRHKLLYFLSQMRQCSPWGTSLRLKKHLSIFDFKLWYINVYEICIVSYRIVNIPTKTSGLIWYCKCVVRVGNRMWCVLKYSAHFRRAASLQHHHFELYCGSEIPYRNWKKEN
jgi:hypothetical protein